MKSLPLPIRLLLFASLASLLCTSCGTSRDLPEGSYILEHTGVETDRSDVDAGLLEGYIRQKPAKKFLSLIRKPRSKAVLYDTLLAQRSASDIRMAVQNTGYLHADVSIENKLKDNKVETKYVVKAGEPFYISSFQTEINDSGVGRMLERNPDLLKPLRPGRRFSVQALNDVRKNVVALLVDSGYYRFHKDFIGFSVDTAANSYDVDVKMTLYKYKASSSAEEKPHQQYRIGEVVYNSGDNDGLHLRGRVLRRSTAFNSGDLYSASALQRTYSNFARLGAVRYTNISFSEKEDSMPGADPLLDCDITVSTYKPSTVSFQPEGTNTAGDLGAAASLTYENRNLFRCSELLTIQARAAFEAITGLEGYQNQDYQEYGIEAKLTVPRFMAPFVSRDFVRRSRASTEMLVSYDLQNRPEFHRRVYTTTWRYRWTSLNGNIAYRFDLLDLNYVYMPWISTTFKEEYLENTDNRNAILRYNYEDLFIMKVGFGVSINRGGYSLRTNVETSGNVLHALAHATHFSKNDDGQYTLFRIAYAQYVKGDIDFTRLFQFEDNSQLAFHAALGLAYPYGNSTILPFEKRYFSGGANSVRGWNVRGLGPGKFQGTDGRIDFINQTGDVKLDLSLEYRTKPFWKLSGAMFIDAGNIWTLRDYADQEGGQFKFNEFYKQIAVAYGVGIRFNFDYFIVRFDFGMKAVNPAYDTAREHFPIYHPNLGRDLAVHFAVGLPF